MRRLSLRKEYEFLKQIYTKAHIRTSSYLHMKGHAIMHDPHALRRRPKPHTRTSQTSTQILAYSFTCCSRTSSTHARVKVALASITSFCVHKSGKWDNTYKKIKNWENRRKNRTRNTQESSTKRSFFELSWYSRGEEMWHLRTCFFISRSARIMVHARWRMSWMSTVSTQKKGSY